MIGPGKYDLITTEIRERLEAEVVLLCVISGSQGSGFSVQFTAQALKADLRRMLPGVLRGVAREIEEDFKTLAQ